MLAPSRMPLVKRDRVRRMREIRTSGAMRGWRFGATLLSCLRGWLGLRAKPALGYYSRICARRAQILGES